MIYEIADFDKLELPTAVKTRRGYFVSTRGIWHGSVITTSELATNSKLNSTAIEHQRDVTSTTIRLKSGHIPIPGVCASILSLLANKGVNLQEVISTHNELTILTDHPNAERTLHTLLGLKTKP